MTPSTQKRADFDFQQADNGIHVLKFHTPSLAAINAMTQYIIEAVEAVRQDTPPVVVYMTDFSESGLPSVRHISHRFRQLKRDLPRNVHLRNAVIHGPGAVMTMFSMVVDLLMRGESMKKAKLFSVDDKTDAVSWLLAEQHQLRTGR